MWPHRGMSPQGVAVTRNIARTLPYLQHRYAQVGPLRRVASVLAASSLTPKLPSYLCSSDTHWPLCVKVGFADPRSHGARHGQADFLMSPFHHPEDGYRLLRGY